LIDKIFSNFLKNTIEAKNEEKRKKVENETLNSCWKILMNKVYYRSEEYYDNNVLYFTEIGLFDKNDLIDVSDAIDKEKIIVGLKQVPQSKVKNFLDSL
jgi:hypothetical protein